MFYLDDRRVYRDQALDRFAWLDHGFGTRTSENWPPSPLATVKQIHSDRVLTVAHSIAGKVGEGDALVTSAPSAWIGVRTADCLPILFVDQNNHAVAAVHAGWRGTVGQSAQKTLGEMTRQSNTAPQDVWAALGPCIGPCCFEVGPEVAVQFERFFQERTDL